MWYLFVFSVSYVHALFVPQKGKVDNVKKSTESVDVPEVTQKGPSNTKEDYPKKSRSPLYPNNPPSPKPTKKSILDFPIFVKKERSPTKPRTPQQEERVITNLIQQVGCSRAEATEVLRRRTAKERAMGCY